MYKIVNGVNERFQVFQLESHWVHVIRVMSGYGISSSRPMSSMSLNAYVYCTIKVRKNLPKNVYPVIETAFKNVYLV